MWTYAPRVGHTPAAKVEFTDEIARRVERLAAEYVTVIEHGCELDVTPCARSTFDRAAALPGDLEMLGSGFDDVFDLVVDLAGIEEMTFHMASSDGDRYDPWAQEVGSLEDQGRLLQGADEFWRFLALSIRRHIEAMGLDADDLFRAYTHEQTTCVRLGRGASHGPGFHLCAQRCACRMVANEAKHDVQDELGLRQGMGPRRRRNVGNRLSQPSAIIAGSGLTALLAISGE